MRILLVYPDISREIQDKDFFLDNDFPSLGINYLATILRKEGHNVSIQDILFDYISNSCQLSSNFTSSVEKTLREIKPQIVGISFLTPSRRESIEIARLVKRINSEALVVAGGAHATVMYEQLLLNYPEIDVVVIGEGEVTFCELVNAIESKSDLHNIKGIAFRGEAPTQVVNTPPRPLIRELDSIPFPDYQQYLQFMPERRLPTASIVTARGCVYGKCKFCASHSLWPNSRSRSAKNVVDEIQMLVKGYGVENIRIHDDTFTSFRKVATDIFRKIVSRKIKVTLDFKTIPSSVTPGLLYWYRKAGGRSIFFGLESGSEKLRDLMGKRKLSNEEIKLVVETTKKAGVKVGVFIMFGYPGETVDDVRETYEMLKNLNPDRVRCMLTKVYPGTQLYRHAKERNLISDEYWLNEDNAHRYFSFASDDEVAEIKGYDLLFREEFNGSELWAEYDEQDIPYLDHNASHLYKEAANQKLFDRFESKQPVLLGKQDSTMTESMMNITAE